jgi:hypothetical protein
LFVPVHRVTGLLETATKRRASQPGRTSLSTERLAKRLEQAARLSPVRITCLMQAIVSRALLMEYGYSSKVCIGVLKSGTEIEAHAWLECAGAQVIGDRSPAGKQFVPIIGAERLVE